VLETHQVELVRLEPKQLARRSCLQQVAADLPPQLVGHVVERVILPYVGAARSTAAILEVNTNTVLRALRQLRDEGLLEFRRRG
jgi:DNA-binding transcriptional regulator YhcF (GntR family)